MMLLARREGNDTHTASRAFRALGRWRPVQIVDLDALTLRVNRFYVYGPATRLLDLLRNRGAVLVFKGRDPDNQLFATSRPGPNYLFEVILEPVVRSLRCVCRKCGADCDLAEHRPAACF